MNKPRVIAVLGPTASGKTSCAIDLAEQFAGEVVSADSRQVYRGLNLSSGKVTDAEMRGVPHHLLDVAELREVYTASDFVRDATAAIDDILARGRTPIIAGGTNFYVDLLRGKQQAAPVPPNPTLRERLDTYSTAALYEELRERDPRRAGEVDPNNRHRLIRALEIVATLGVVPQTGAVEAHYAFCCIGLSMPLPELTERIGCRLHERIESGLVDEIRSLHEAGMPWERLDELGLEQRYTSWYLQGRLTYDAYQKELVTKTRQFAKRQLTWLQRDEAIAWFDPHDQEAVSAHIEKFLRTA